MPVKISGAVRAVPRPTLAAAYLGILGTAAALLVILNPVRPNDLWWHLQDAEQIIRNGRIPTVDTHSLLHSGERFVDQEWLGQLGLLAAYRVGGLYGELVLRLACVGAALTMLTLCLARRISRPRTWTAVGLGVLMVLLPELALRPQIFAFVFFAATLLLLDPALGVIPHPPSRAVWALPPVMALWANTHGTFVLGLLLLAAAVAGITLSAHGRAELQGDKAGGRRLVAVTAASVAATLVNPIGPGVYGYVAHLGGSAAVRHYVQEWEPTRLSGYAGYAFFAWLAAVIVLAVLAPNPSPPEALVLGGFAVLALLATRNTGWFALASAPFVATRWQLLVRDRHPVDRGNPAANAGILAMLALVLVASWPAVRGALGLSERLVSADTPVGASHFLESRPQLTALRMYTSDGNASYLSYAVPAQRTLVDTRFELYSASEVRDAILLSDGYELDHVVRRYDLQEFLVDRVTQAALTGELAASPSWRRVYQDGRDELYVRSDLPVAALMSGA